jgi:hypothetical protein
MWGPGRPRNNLLKCRTPFLNETDYCRVDIRQGFRGSSRVAWKPTVIWSVRTLVPFQL